MQFLLSVDEEYKSALSAAYCHLVPNVEKMDMVSSILFILVSTILLVGSTTANTTNEDILSAIRELTNYIKHPTSPGLTPSHPATSCMEILQLAPQSPSGLYWIRASEHAVKQMYCDMERSCKGVGGGWMRPGLLPST